MAEAGLSTVDSALSHVGLRIEQQPVAQAGRMPSTGPKKLYIGPGGNLTNKNSVQKGRGMGAWRSDAKGSAHDEKFAHVEGIRFKRWLVLNCRYARDALRSQH